jgi:hypothetical protein
MNVRPHLTQNTNGRRSDIDGRTRRATPVTPSASASENASRKPSAGLRPSPARAKPGSEASSGSAVLIDLTTHGKEPVAPARDWTPGDGVSGIVNAPCVFNGADDGT